MTPLLSVADVARQLGVSPRYVHARIAAHELRAIAGVGRGFRIRPEWVDAFLASREVAAPEKVASRPGARAARRRPRADQPFKSAAEARAALKLVPGGSP